MSAYLCWCIIALTFNSRVIEASEPVSLADALKAAIQPILLNYSLSCRPRGASSSPSAWAFAYRDGNVTAEACAGFSDADGKVPCSTTRDKYAWGSTTKTQTSLMVLKLVDKGVVNLDDSVVPHVDPFLRKISNGTLDLVGLYGDTVNKVTVRSLLQMSSGINEYDNPKVRAYQNLHRDEDLSPMWILNQSNRSWLCEPGTCGRYSSTNFVILGLLLGHHTNATNWDTLDQTSWMPSDNGNEFNQMYYGVHGELKHFFDANKRTSSSIHGFQPMSRFHNLTANESDVINMSSTQGWTCGNLVAPPRDIASYFWRLLGPPSVGDTALLSAKTQREMLTFRVQQYFPSRSTALNASFGYGLGMMNFTSMTWGFANHGLYYGHNGLTYGFGSQSGYNYRYNFSASWVNNCEKWIGPTGQKGQSIPNELYEVLSFFKQHKTNNSSNANITK
eukprot:m.137793 g.137793  ORF g.137793 m.137793 type:complete len:447 (-) comp29948_c2_seq1:12-1352(-)